MNKKGHHEIGITPYVLLTGIIGTIILYFRKKTKKLKQKI